MLRCVSFSYYVEYLKSFDKNDYIELYRMFPSKQYVCVFVSSHFLVAVSQNDSSWSVNFIYLFF